MRHNKSPAVSPSPDEAALKKSSPLDVLSLLASTVKDCQTDDKDPPKEEEKETPEEKRKRRQREYSRRSYYKKKKRLELAEEKEQRKETRQPTSVKELGLRDKTISSHLEDIHEKLFSGQPLNKWTSIFIDNNVSRVVHTSFWIDRDYPLCYIKKPSIGALDLNVTPSTSTARPKGEENQQNFNNKNESSISLKAASGLKDEGKRPAKERIRIKNRDELERTFSVQVRDSSGAWCYLFHVRPTSIPSDGGKTSDDGNKKGRMGLFAARPFRAKEMLGIFIGSVREAAIYPQSQRSPYAMSTLVNELEFVVDPGRPDMGDPDRRLPVYFGLHFANDPNFSSDVKIASSEYVKDRYNIKIYDDLTCHATRDIAMEEELFLDYSGGNNAR